MDNFFSKNDENIENKNIEASEENKQIGWQDEGTDEVQYVFDKAIETETVLEESAGTEGVFEEAVESSEEVIQPEQNHQQFYREVVEKKPKTSKLLIASVLSAGLMLGTIFGYTVDNFILDNNNAIQYVGAVNSQDNIKYVVEKSVTSIEYIAEKVSPAVVAIQTMSLSSTWFGTQTNEGLGSGVIISEDGYIVTNNHVIDYANDIKVVLSDGREFEARLINRDKNYDLAVLKIEGSNLPYAEFGDSSTVKVGQLAVAIGNPVGKQYSGTVTAGIISGLDRVFKGEGSSVKYIQTDAAINPGNSGGALVNAEGKIIGINTLKVVETTVEGMGFAIPANEVKSIVNELMSTPLVERPYMGITGRTVTKEDSEKYEVPQGVYVVDIVPLSGADRGGIGKGDIITAIDGKKILTMEELLEVLKDKKIDEVIEVELYNKYDKKVNVKVKLSRYVG